MDPLSVTAGVLSIASLATKVSRSILESVTFEEKNYSTAVKLELEIYTNILEEVGQIALSGLSELPESAKLSLQLCHLHLSSLADVAEKARPQARKKLFDDGRKAGQMKSLQTGLKDYRRSVKILREIVTDAMTQQALDKNIAQKYREINSTGTIKIRNIIDTNQCAEMVEKQMETMNELFNSDLTNTGSILIENVFTDRATEQDGVLEDVLARLRKAAEGVAAASGPTQSPPNPFEFFAKIIRTEQSDQDETSVCANLDTGSKDNWISASIVHRIQLEDSIVPVETDKMYRGADGSLFQPMGMLSVSWTRNSTKSWQTDFLIVENAPFDMLLGREFIIKEGLFVFADPVLVTDLTRLSPLSRDDYYQMEQNVRKRGIENEELSMTREAKDAAARARRRAEKAASRMSHATSSISLAITPGTMTPSSFQPTPSLQSQSNIVTPATTGDHEYSSNTLAQDDASKISRHS
ncbi:hypothetical protein K505DRAFT_343884 [Melanomma pulvis-pyrius CBS 109.77]|uniref:Fungal N-terminal domain-containing protein n=1 Tax=Melanomma pulvis-pyrius CBS 109.77 TaxID=1314802 RepID=A0A6A6WQJ6_9PLEO|nr:hypothetical protein K505DRAFT_343884 [Melanomma pulvis-pyrius CBS 109.77]